MPIRSNLDSLLLKKIMSQVEPALQRWNGRFFALHSPALHSLKKTLCRLAEPNGAKLFWQIISVVTLISWLIIGAAFSTHAQDAPAFNRDEVPLPTGLPSAQSGGLLFSENCAPCHGQFGESDGPVVDDLPAPPPQFSDPETVWDQSPAAYFHVTKFGRIENLMPPWGNRLSDDQIWQAVFYAWSLHTDEAQADAGKQLLDAALANADPAKGTQVDALFTDTDSLWRTQAELAGELQTILPTVDWSPTEWSRVLDYGRTLAYIPPWGSAFRPGNGSIEGRVALVSIDGSSQQPEGNINIVINAFADRELVTAFETTTDADGNFAVAELSTNSNVFYVPEAIYNDIVYRGDAIQLNDSAPVAAALLSVYETTDDPSGLMISRLNWVVDNAPGELVIGQIMTLGNRLAATYIGKALEGAAVPVTAEIAVPVDAYDVRFQDGEIGEGYVQVGDRFFDTMPITPGNETRQIFVSYRLPYDGTQVSIEQDVMYPVDSLNLLVADLPEMQEEVSVLEFAGLNSVQNVSYRLWQGTDVAPQPVTIALSGLIAADATDPRVENLGAANPNAGQAGSEGLVAATPPLDPMIPLAVGGLLTALLAGLVIWPLRRQQQIDPVVALGEERNSLIREIARLDDEHAAGKLGTEAWTAKRAVLKTRLIKVALELEATENPAAALEGTGESVEESTGESTGDGQG